MKQQSSISLIIMLFVFFSSYAQSSSPKLENFGDISSISKPDQSKWQQLKTSFSFSPSDVSARINYNQFPVLSNEKHLGVEGWVGETVNLQAVVSSKMNIPALKITISDFTSLTDAKTIAGKNASVGYVYYVLADNTPGVCQKKNYDYQSMIVPDIIDFTSGSAFVNNNTNRPVWINIKIPADASPGKYKAQVTATDGKTTGSIEVLLTVNKNKLPQDTYKDFFLNLWQYPIAEAEYYNIKPWSDEHFSLMKPAMERLKGAGQKVITTCFFWDIFNSKVRSADDMMIKVIKTKEGKWQYDFTNFDKWVNFMMGLGIAKQIECFGMASLNYRYYYLDEKDNGVKFFSEGVNGKNYAEFWKPYLNAFEQHLKEKNWFTITTIGIDEKGADVLSALIKFIKNVNQDWKISFTGRYFAQLQDSIYDYSVISNQQIPDSIVTQRRNKGFITTFYTSCWEIFPNTFTISSHADATWLSWNAAYRNLDGYLRWAYDYFGKKILTDTRASIASGDNFLIYPYGYSSIRFEMLKDGIEDFVKIKLKQKQGNFSQQFNSTLSQFDFKKVNAKINRSEQINKARQVLND